MAQGTLSQGHSLRLALRGCRCAQLRAAQQPRNPRAAPAVTFSTRSRRSKAGAAWPGLARLGSALPGPAWWQEARGGAAPTPSAAQGAGGAAQSRGCASAGKRLRGGRLPSKRSLLLILLFLLPLILSPPPTPGVIFGGNNREYQRLFAKGPSARRCTMRALLGGTGLPLCARCRAPLLRSGPRV